MNNIEAKRSFTLVETLVVIAVTGIVLPTLFSILFLIMRQQVKIYRLSEVKRQGDSIVTLLENTIRNNAFRIYSDSIGSTETCSITNASLVPVASFRDMYGSLFSFATAGSPSILSSSGTVAAPPAPTLSFSIGQLSNTKVSVTNFIQACSRGSTLYSGPIINISFDICYWSGSSCAAGVDAASLSYQTSIKLRNFPTQ